GFEKAPASLGDVIQDSLTLCRCDLDFKRATVTSDIDPTLPEIPLHAGKMKQVLINLFRNAAQAMPRKDAGKIEVTLRRDGDEAGIAVKDSGCGMPPDVLKRIGEPFFTTKGESGTGLGIRICREIIENHSGRLVVTSEVGVGSTFEVRLPLRLGGG